jgi:cytochrome c oxidase subunit II
MIRRSFIGCGVAVALGGCNGFQTALAGDAAESAKFIDLFVIFMIVCTLMYALVVAGLALALWRRREAREELTVETGNHEPSRPFLKTALVVWVGLMAVGLIGLTIASFFVDRSNAAAASKPTLLIKVTANQWWWDVEYQASDPSKIVRTANEIHLPIGVPVRIELRSRDVIHSLWIPNLAGKQDLVPGRVTDLHILARRAGLYRGQCAEFCGTQHANMALDVTVESKADFQRWAAAQRRPALAPRTSLELAGYRYFTTRECSVCHNISGSPASARVGPDLTHFASRRSIAAGTLPMNKGNLYGWVADPQAQKPGNHMPTVGLSSDELHALVAYLERLK